MSIVSSIIYESFIGDSMPVKQTLLVIFAGLIIYIHIMSEELKQLLEWFNNYEIIFNEIRLSQCQYIFDLRKFISVQTNSVRKNWENPTFEYEIISLYQLKKVLEDKENENMP